MKAITIFLFVGILFFAGCAGNPETATTTTQEVATTAQNITTTIQATTTTEPVTTTSTPTTTTTSSTTTTTQVKSKVFYVNITNSIFVPFDLKINRGDTVVWTNNDKSPHTVVSSFGTELDSPSLGRGDTFNHTFNQVGIYAYQCRFNAASMNARIVVLEQTSKTTTLASNVTTTNKSNRPYAY